MTTKWVCKRRMVSSLALALVWLLVPGLPAAPPAQAAPFIRPVLDPGNCVVTTTADSGPGSLRACMLQLAAGDTITFSTAVFPPASPATVALLSPLPEIITDSVTIDGSSAGVILDGSGLAAGDGLSIQANGTTVRGLQILHFPGGGVRIDGAAQNNRIGGDRGIGSGPLGQGNLISDNAGSGVGIFGSGAMSNTVSANYIGTNISGTAALGNVRHGVIVAAGAQHNLIGGDTPGERNLISGTTLWHGVSLEGSGTDYNTVSGNYIGTNASGNASIPNEAEGVWIAQGASHNLIGGDTPGAANVISGNRGNGVAMGGSGTNDNTVSGNYIGTNAGGTAALGNGASGVSLEDSAAHNLIGGDTAGERNLISRNGDRGVVIDGSGTMSNTIAGNYIGVDVSGTKGLGNAWMGVDIRGGAQANTVGGRTAGERNIISGNGFVGVGIWDSGTDNNIVIGNYIGTDASGTAAVGNATEGVCLGDGPEYNTVGGTTPAERNIISGNGHDGVGIGGAHSNLIAGNYIGTDVSGMVALGNTERGIGINEAGRQLATTQNIVEHNLISGNGTDGIDIYGANTTTNTLRGNLIGTNAAGTSALGNGSQGVWMGGGAHHNTIGGSTAQDGNIISGNGMSGLALMGDGIAYNVIAHNYIGSDATGTLPIPNTYAGVALFSGAHNNVVGPGNTIAFNGHEGVWVGTWQGSPAISNTITCNSIFSNTLEGISLAEGGNQELFPPILTDVSTNTVRGTAPPGSTVEIFSDAADEGRYFHGAVVVDAAGNFSYSQASAFTGANVTATATDAQGNTSEFSAPYHPLVDVQVISILEPKATVEVNHVVTPTVRIENGGTGDANGVEVGVTVAGPALGAAYEPPGQRVTLPSLGSANLAFPPLALTRVGTYTMVATVWLVGDQNNTNDAGTTTFSVGTAAIDLWTRDAPDDTGDIPYSGTWWWWESPDLWVRNQCDGGTQHQSPIADQVNCVYMLVRNRGTAASHGVDEARVYWVEPSLAIKCGGWAPVGTEAIPSVPASGGTQLLSFMWSPPRTGHTCLMSEINSVDDPIADLSCWWFYPAMFDNNISQRNIEILSGGLPGEGPGAQAQGSAVFGVSNIKALPKSVTVYVDVSQVSASNAVRLDLGGTLAARWASVNGLAKSSGIAWSAGSIITVADRQRGIIAGIPMAAGETQTVTLLLNAPSLAHASVRVFEAIDDGAGRPLMDSIVGGNTYMFGAGLGTVHLPVVLKQ